MTVSVENILLLRHAIINFFCEESFFFNQFSCNFDSDIFLQLMDWFYFCRRVYYRMNMMWNDTYRTQIGATTFQIKLFTNFTSLVISWYEIQKFFDPEIWIVILLIVFCRKTRFIKALSWNWSFHGQVNEGDDVDIVIKERLRYDMEIDSGIRLL